jgi:hypothetical protein
LFFYGRPRKACTGNIAQEKTMDIQQLKLLAERVRDLLQQSNHPVGHSQSLDLVAALPGLRNWPEVQAFPDRVAACELDAASTSRLAFRLKKKFDLELSPQAMLAAVSPPEAAKPTRAPKIWPTGPKPGVYVTTSENAINALLERYEEATDGALVYAERAGNHWDGSIDLGEYGLWSSGLSRVSSGTLLVVGPVRLNQQSWSDSASRLEKACLDAQTVEHRVAVLIETSSPEAMCEDVLLMVRSIQSEVDDCDAALLGVVTEEGELERRDPFAHSRPRPAQVRSVATVGALPPAALAPLQNAVAERSSGLLLFGSAIIGEHAAIDLVVASLALTEHAGPAARIKPRDRSTPAKDWNVPEAIKQLPFLPSIESAYDQGYRRMIFSPYYTEAETLLEFGKDVLLISGTYGSEVEDIFISTLRGSGIAQESDLLAHVITILGVKPIPGKHGEVVVSDLYLKQQGKSPMQPMKFEDICQFLQENRILKWQDEMMSLLDSGRVTAASLKKALPRNQYISEFLSQRAAAKKSSAALH